MGLMERRRMMASSGGEAPTPTPTYGGLPIYLDNSYYTGGNGKIGAVSSSDDFFITGIFDTGDSSTKNYTITRWRTSINAQIRFFNDITATSYDYWTIMRTDVDPGQANIYNFSSGGRYVAISVAKYCAADFYFKFTNGAYIIKGNNIT